MLKVLAIHLLSTVAWNVSQLSLYICIYLYIQIYLHICVYYLCISTCLYISVSIIFEYLHIGVYLCLLSEPGCGWCRGRFSPNPGQKPLLKVTPLLIENVSGVFKSLFIFKPILECTVNQCNINIKYTHHCKYYDYW